MVELYSFNLLVKCRRCHIFVFFIVVVVVAVSYRFWQEEMFFFIYLLCYNFQIYFHFRRISALNGKHIRATERISFSQLGQHYSCARLHPAEWSVTADKRNTRVCIETIPVPAKFSETKSTLNTTLQLVISTVRLIIPCYGVLYDLYILCICMYCENQANSVHGCRSASHINRI